MCIRKRCLPAFLGSATRLVTCNFRRLNESAAFFFLVLLMTTVGVADEPAFPQASPAECGLSAEAIQLLDASVQQMVEQAEVVGAELHIIKDRKTVFHQAYGWADREQQRPLQVDSIYCVRSMTKPILGTAIQMLIDDGKLTLDDRVADILPAFDRPATEQITIEHLLTHTSGLPLSAIGRPLAEYSSLAKVATDAAEAGVSFQPGTRFQYSDAGSDTLGAALEAVSGSSAEQFITNRILEPLKMNDAITLLDGDENRRQRIPSAYSGDQGQWQRHWQPTDQPIFPLFLTSQSLYCTTTDYARFLALWMDEGVHDGDVLLSPEAIERALSPGRRISEYPGGFDPLIATYGQQWVLHHGEGARRPAVFGHDGSDGTYAWAWPEQDLIVLFFTQSRGTLAGLELASAVGRLLIKGDVAGYQQELLARKDAAATLQRYEGIYWDQDVETAYYVISSENGELVIERPGRFRSVARPQSKEGAFSLAAGVVKIEFEGDAGPAPAMLLKSLASTERQVRHQPADSLPAIEDVLALVGKAHGIQKLADSGVLKMSGTIKMGPLGRSGKIRQWFDDHRSRTEMEFGDATTTVIINGLEAAATGAGGDIERLEGVARQQALLGHPAIQFGRWHEGYNELDVLKQVTSGEEGQTVWLVRARADGVPTSTLIVDADSGQVVGEQGLEYMPGGGFIGEETAFSDFREIAGITLPFRIESDYAHPLIGKMVIQYESHETGVEPADLFQLPPENSGQ